MTKASCRRSSLALTITTTRSHPSSFPSGLASDILALFSAHLSPNANRLQNAEFSAFDSVGFTICCVYWTSFLINSSGIDYSPFPKRESRQDRRWQRTTACKSWVNITSFNFNDLTLVNGAILQLTNESQHTESPSSNLSWAGGVKERVLQIPKSILMPNEQSTWLQQLARNLPLIRPFSVGQYQGAEAFASVDLAKRK